MAKQLSIDLTERPEAPLWPDEKKTVRNLSFRLLVSRIWDIFEQEKDLAAADIHDELVAEGVNPCNIGTALRFLERGGHIQKTGVTVRAALGHRNNFRYAFAYSAHHSSPTRPEAPVCASTVPTPAAPSREASF